jgi:hypothetical protein
MVRGMTKAQLKEQYLEWNRNIGKLEIRKDEIFNEMQELNYSDGDGHKWCSMQTNFEGIVKFSKEKYSVQKAFELIQERSFIEGQHEALKNLALATKNFEI